MKNSLSIIVLAVFATLLIHGNDGAVNRTRRGTPVWSHPSPSNLGMTTSQRSWYANQGFPNPTYNRWTTGYQNFHGVGKYKVHREGMPWDHALNVCAMEGSILAVIDDFREAHIIKGLILGLTSQGYALTASGMNYYWIGAKEMGTNMQFVTLHGTTLGSPGYLNWSPSNSQPDNYGNEDCVGFMHDATNFDADCSENFGFVCEKVT